MALKTACFVTESRPRLDHLFRIDMDEIETLDTEALLTQPSHQRRAAIHRRNERRRCVFNLFNQRNYAPGAY